MRCGGGGSGSGAVVSLLVVRQRYWWVHIESLIHRYLTVTEKKIRNWHLCYRGVCMINNSSTIAAIIVIVTKPIISAFLLNRFESFEITYYVRTPLSWSIHPQSVVVIDPQWPSSRKYRVQLAILMFPHWLAQYIFVDIVVWGEYSLDMSKLSIPVDGGSSSKEKYEFFFNPV